MLPRIPDRRVAAQGPFGPVHGRVGILDGLVSGSLGYRRRHRWILGHFRARSSGHVLTLRPRDLVHTTVLLELLAVAADALVVGGGVMGREEHRGGEDEEEGLDHVELPERARGGATVFVGKSGGEEYCGGRRRLEGRHKDGTLHAGVSTTGDVYTGSSSQRHGERDARHTQRGIRKGVHVVKLIHVGELPPMATEGARMRTARVCCGSEYEGSNAYEPDVFGVGSRVQPAKRRRGAGGRIEGGRRMRGMRRGAKWGRGRGSV